MAGTIKLPGLGETKKVYVWGAVAIVVVIVGVAYYRRSHQSPAAATAAGAGNAAAAIDPETGYPQGSPEDLAALQALNESTTLGSGGFASDIGDTGTGAAGNLYYDPADGLYDLTSPYVAPAGGSSTSNTGPGTFTSNAYWVQYAIANVQAYSAGDIQGALALYLAGQGLTTTQMSIYQSALAVAGPPPEPPATAAHLVTQSTGTGTGTGTTGGGTFAVPGGLAEKPSPTSVTISWDKETGASLYHYQVLLAAGTKSIKDSETTATSVTVSGLHPKTQYEWRMAVNKNGSTNSSPWSPTRHFFTT